MAGGSVISRHWAPNPLPCAATPADTSWYVVAQDGTTYASLALLLAAGKRTYPGLDGGGKIDSCLIRSIDTGGADGSAFDVAQDKAAAPTNPDDLVSGSGQQVSLVCPFRNIWIRSNGTDTILIDGRY